MEQSFENTFRLPYLFKLYSLGVPMGFFLKVVEQAGYEVSSRDPHGFVSIRMKDPPWWHIVNNRSDYSCRVKETLLTLFRRCGVECDVIDSP